MDNTHLAGPKALGEFLRTHRENTAPESVGLPTTARRRTRGLRREEVALLSGISTTWYTWIEQGRDVAVSAQTLSHIALALNMKTAERHYLFQLAHLHDPQAESVPRIDESALAAVHQVNVPCYILDLTLNMLAWNEQAATLFAGWLGEEAQPNMMRFMFTHPLAKMLVIDWEKRAARIVAELRAEAMHYPDDHALKRFVEKMCETSPQFQFWWSRQQVMVREGGERHFQHQAGRQHFQHVSWQLTSNRSLKMIMLMPEPG